MKRNTKLIILLGIILFLIYLTDQNRLLIPTKEIYKNEIKYIEKSFESDIEELSRYNARQMAKGIGECIRLSNPKTVEEARHISYKCGAFHRSGGETGDFFVVDLLSKQFIYDGSPDCMKGGELRHLTEEEECFMHENKSFCIKAINKILQSFNTTEQTKAFWKFDDARERLEWYIIPTERDGFLGSISKGGIKDNKDNFQLVVVMGTQSDEVKSRFDNTVKRYNTNNKRILDFFDNIALYYFICIIITCILCIVCAIKLIKG